jgi:hypothetical protein
VLMIVATIGAVALLLYSASCHLRRPWAVPW